MRRLSVPIAIVAILVVGLGQALAVDVSHTVRTYRAAWASWSDAAYDGSGSLLPGSYHTTVAWAMNDVLTVDGVPDPGWGPRSVCVVYEEYTWDGSTTTSTRRVGNCNAPFDGTLDVARGLTTAHFAAEVPVYELDCCSDTHGAYVGTMQLDLEYTGTGPVGASGSGMANKVPPLLYAYHMNSGWRAATVTGSLLLNGTSLISPATLQGAEIDRQDEGYALITK